MKVTYNDLLASRVPASVGACPDSPRLLGLTNESLERLMYEGHFHGSTQRFRSCAVDGCVTQPPQIASIESLSVCGRPMTLRTQWFEFAESGPGIQSGCSGGCGMNSAVFRGYYPTFGDITGLNKKVVAACDLASDVGVKILVCGYDENLNWIRTTQNGLVQDGELLTLAQGDGVTSTHFFSSITDVQLNEERDGQVWMWELNTDTSIKRLIANYQAFETHPDYARYFFANILTGSTSNGACNQTLVEGIAKLNFWPVKTGTDLLCIPCIPALKEMIQALNDAEHEPDGVKKKQLIAAGMVTAKAILNSQLQHFVGDGAVPIIQVMGSNMNDPVPFVI